MTAPTPVPRSAAMSRENYTTCPCWDPWKIGCKRLIRTRMATPAQMPKSYSIGAGTKDQSKSQISLKSPSAARMKFIPGTNKLPLRSREPQDISKDFIQLSPGFLLSHMKGQFSVTLQEEFFEKKRSSEPSFSKSVLPSTPPKLESQDIVADLVEQISELTGFMEQLRRDHEVSHRQLENEMEEKLHDLQEEHETKLRKLEALHQVKMNNLEEQHRKELRTERATAQEKLSGMLKEYKYLKNAFRVYQDSISDEMEEKWLRRQTEWKKSERTEREKALLQQKQSLTKKFEMELEEQKKLIQSNSFLINKAYQKEREDFLKQHDEDLEKIRILTEKIDALEGEIKEKNETLNAIASTLHNTELELQHEKIALAEAERSVQQRIAIIEEKHRINMNSLVEENIALRRKLIEKNEEILNERSQRSLLF